jgi:hypothetical protein
MLRVFRAVPLVVLSLATACGAVYPELSTPLRAPAAATPLEPPPPKDVKWIAIKEGVAPERTRDGRAWHELGSKKPDPYAILFVNGKAIIRTNPEGSTLHPTWPDSPRGNFRIAQGDKVRVEMWESSLTQRPMCVKDLGFESDDWTSAHQVAADCEGGARVVIAWEPAHGRLGYGFHYELRTYDAYVTRVFQESPAGRAGIKPGDQIVSVNDRRVKEMKEGELQSKLNAPTMDGVKLELVHADKSPLAVTLKEGAVYPLYSESGSLP